MASTTANVGAISERRLLWKIDLLLMPLMTVAYGLQFYDKAILGSASIFGILKDLELSVVHPGQPPKASLERYSTATSAFYWGYLVAALPMALLVQRFGPNLFLGCAIVLWGIIVILTPAIASWRGLIAQRFFLGAIESAVRYNKFSPEQKSLAVGRLRSNITGELEEDDDATARASSVDENKADALEEKTPSTPSHGEPTSAPLPTAGLKDKLASLNVSASTSGIREHWNMAQIKEAFLDYKLYIFFLQAIAIYVCNGGVTAFGAYIIRSFGYTSIRSIILQTPGGATTCISIYISTIFVLKVRNSRSVLLILTCLPVMVGAAMIWKGNWSNRAIPLAGYYLLPIFGAPFVLMLSLSTANVAGATKQSITSAMVFAGYNVGNIVAPYLTIASEAPIHYRTTFVAIITCMAITIGLTVLLDVGLWWQNKSRRERRERERKSKNEVEEIKKKAILEDWTDWENPYFEYAY
ncbi:hypothetical protein NDA16_005075 [Ustilago loliicola]|nr:hypothetical protein NDA16_005075 [Ustilago loliicola]